MTNTLLSLLQNITHPDTSDHSGGGASEKSQSPTAERIPRSSQASPLDSAPALIRPCSQLLSPSFSFQIPAPASRNPCFLLYEILEASQHQLILLPPHQQASYMCIYPLFLPFSTKGWKVCLVVYPWSMPSSPPLPLLGRSIHVPASLASVSPSLHAHILRICVLSSTSPNWPRFDPAFLCLVGQVTCSIAFCFM